jgi:hypothetical protein
MLVVEFGPEYGISEVSIEKTFSNSKLFKEMKLQLELLR